MFNNRYVVLSAIFLILVGNVWVFISAIKKRIQANKQKEIEFAQMDKFDKLAEGIGNGGISNEMNLRAILGSAASAIMFLIVIVLIFFKKLHI